MDLDMSIAALSVSMAQARTGEALGVSVLKEAMAMDGEAIELMSEIAGSLDPDLGTLVDIQA